MHVGRYGALGLLLTLALLLCASASSADTPGTRWITLRFSHPGGVAGFRVYVRDMRQAYGPGVDVGLPDETDGVYEAKVEVSNLEACYAAVAAIGVNGVESELSNSRLFPLTD
jgi:hypothetical protein